MLLNDAGKLLEAVVMQRLEAHLEAKGGLSRSQYGFRRGQSTDDAGCRLRVFAQEAINVMKICVAVLLDVRNAFNNVGWGHVLDALEAWDVPPYVSRLLASYFTDRSVEVECLEGPVRVEVTCGVPQGTFKFFF